MSERLQGIATFVATVEAGSFSAAGERLQLSRSAVGKAIARLETRLGVRLFHRTTRSQRLTEDGQMYYERCRRALVELDEASVALEAGRSEPVGHLRLSMPELLGRRCVAPLLLELGREHAGLSVEVAFTDRRIDLLEERIDLALRIGPLADSGLLAARPLGRQWMGVYATAAYLAAHPHPHNLDELQTQRDQHNYIVYARDGGFKPWLFTDEAGRTTSFEVTSRFACDSLEVVAEAGVAGLGLVRLPTWLAAPALRSGALVRVFDEPYPYGYEINAIWPQARVMPQRLRVVIDRLVQRLPALLASC
ncbi:LysR family transcriptional regulator [Rhodoferax sp.]|uniref:LysR family transcriptional regulator n=1 Tax=Rhodoferax sp. TaxID=50421 RepID=UPI00261FD448|nr:LysR family transcriptional regulator [Rhodoferax sp.]MDD2924444.1 LysR family transcriptional regulator [Rhodoferax sp.]